MKFFRSTIRNVLAAQARRSVLQSRLLSAALATAGIAGASLTAWQARAALPRWMQDAVGSSAIEAALYRVMEIPGAKALYPRPPKEAQGELSGLIGKAPDQADLYSLRAMEEEQALNFHAAEADWKTYLSRTKDTVGARLELAGYYYRRMQVKDEVATLLEVGSAPAQPGEEYTAASAQRSWKAFERVLTVAADQGLDDEVVARCYAAWIARYPHQPSLYARQFRWLLDQSRDAKKFDLANDTIKQYRKAFPQDAVFPLKATALLELRRGTQGANGTSGTNESVEKALAIYDAGFQPLWPAQLVESYYALLGQTHHKRRFLSDARARLAANPDDLNAMARLFYYSQQQGNLENAQQVVEAYRLSKESRKADWSAQELYTLATLMEAIHAYPEAARYDFALYHSKGSLASGDSAQAEGLSGMIRILLTAPDQPMELGAGNLSMYRDIATLDRGPGYWNGILSLWLNSESPERSYHEEEQRAQPYFHRAKAAELLAVLDKSYPKAVDRADLHKQLIQVFADYGESGLVIKAGNDFLNSFTSPADQSNRVLVATYMADAYARQKDMRDEFSLYDRMLSELSAKNAGMPLTAAAASHQGAIVAQPEENPQESPEENTSPGSVGPGAAAKSAEKSRAFEVSAGQPTGIFVAGSQEYQQLLERYLGRLTSTGQLPEALAVLRKELDRNPNDPLLYERLANFLQQNNLSAQQEEVYNQAILKFQDKGWYDKLARVYLREKKREAFIDLTHKVTGIFQGTELESYFSLVNRGSPQLFLELNLYAHQRFPHDEVFVNNLLAAYRSKTTYDLAAWEKLLREHWSDTEQLRQEFFDYLSSRGKLDAEIAQLNSLAPDAQAQKANPEATRELAEIAMWQSHFEASAPLLGELAEAYPTDETIGTRASSVFRSLAYYETAQTDRAVSVEKQLLAYRPSDTDRLARIGDIYADSGADTTTGHENIAAAAPYWRRIPAVHPGSPDGYLQAATIFWDYFQFDEALEEIHEARTKFKQPVLYGYEAGAIYEGKRDVTDAIHEYTAAATAEDSSAGGEAAERLLQLARRKSTGKIVDEATAKAAEANGSIAALELRERVLESVKRTAEIGPLLEAALAKSTSLDQVEAIGAQAQAHSLAKIYELALQREVGLAADPVQKIQLSYDLARSYEARKDTEDATRLITQIYDDNSKLLGVVRATTDFYWRNKQPAKAIDTLTAAAEAARAAQPAVSRQLVAEAANKANDSGSYAQARSLMAPLMDPGKAEGGGYDPYDAQYIAIVADSYARAGDDAALKQFYLAELTAIRNASATMPAQERKEKTVLLRRGLIPALTRMKDYAGAVDQYSAILSAYPEDEGTTQEAALYALRYSRQRQLADFLNNTVKASPRDSRFTILLAQVQTTFSDYPAAIDAYAHVIAIRSDRADLYEAKADLEERLLRLDDACREYERLYVLSYQNPEWMVRIATVRARQRRNEDAVKALQRAWIEGHPVSSSAYFRVATQLEAWNMLDDSLHFAELGVKSEGRNLLAGSEPGDRNGDDPNGANIYARLLTRKRQLQKALVVLDAAREDANQSTYSPGVLVEQAEKQGLASVTNDEWRRRHIEQRRRTAAQRYQSAVLEMGKTVGTYFAPEEKQRFAQLLEARWKSSQANRLDRSNAANEYLQWLDAAGAAGLTDVEERMRRQLLFDAQLRKDMPSNWQWQPYVQLQRSRLDYKELAQVMDDYAKTQTYEERVASLIEEANAYRDAGDEIAELHTMDKINFEANSMAGDRERYLKLLLKHDLSRFESFGGSDGNDDVAFAAPNYAVNHSDLRVARAALNSHATTFKEPWQNAYSALLGVYFHDLSASTESDFHNILGDQRTVGERVETHVNSNAEEDASQQLAGGVWFYYGMRYGVYRTLWPQGEWQQRDPEDFLAAGLEHNPATGNYLDLARAYADANEAAAALTEYRHALELAPDAAAIHDSMAVLLWKSGRKDEALGQWRDALATLNRIQNRGPAPESFWGDFALIAQHISSNHLSQQLHVDLDTVVRGYIARNGNYRSNELLRSAFLASANRSDGVDWIVSLASAASDPASVLADMDFAAWLPTEVREPILLRELELARIAAAHADENDYAAQRVLQMQKALVLYYVAQKQDTKAQTVLDGLTEEERKDGELVMAKLELAARAHRLDAPLAKYRLDAANSLPGTESQLLRNAAGRLTVEGDHSDALALWELVFERGQLNHDLMASDFMGLAHARLAVNNVPGAVEVLRRMTLLSSESVRSDDQGDGSMANYDHAAALLEQTGHDAEAIEFLSALAKGVPWNAVYRLRLANAQVRAAGKATVASEVYTAIASIAADDSHSYDLRVQAAVALRGAHFDSSKLGSEELHLLSMEKIAAEQAQRPYFTAARMVAAESISDSTIQAVLLREAIAISPVGLAGAPGFAGDDLRLRIFRAETALGQDATALDAIQSILRRTNVEPDQSAQSGEGTTAEAENDANTNDDIGSQFGSLESGSESLAQLEAQAPLPVGGKESDGDKAALAALIAQVYERTDAPGNAVPYLKLAVRLQSNPAIHAALERRLEKINIALALETENASRRPIIQRALNQSVLVRPRLTATDVTSGVNRKEAQ